MNAILPEEVSENGEEAYSEQGTGDVSPAESAAEEKKQGFWGKLLNALTQEDEEEEDPAALVSDENGAILEELDKEKKQPKGKKKKKPKNFKKNEKRC